jgi:hypothetical protein
MKRNDHVFMDTDAIIESHRIRYWKILVGHYRLDTTVKCVEECARGRQSKRNYVPVDVDSLREKLSPKTVTKAQLVELEVSLAGAVDLHEGEKYLLAYALTQKDAWLLCSGDGAAVRAAVLLGMKDRLVSLEDLIKSAGLKRVNLRPQFTRRKLKERKTQALLG